MSIENSESIYSPEREALLVLGLDKGATPDEIIDRYIQIFNQNKDNTEEMARVKDALKTLEDIYFPSDPRIKEIEKRVAETMARMDKRVAETMARMDERVKESDERTTMNARDSLERIDRRVEESRRKMGI